jgi:hypothetical protein
VYAVDCPYGIENDTAPGICVRYVDDNGDEYCDLSEDNIIQPILSETTLEIPEITGKYLKVKTIEEVASFYSIDKTELLKHISEHYKIPAKYSDTIQLLHDNYGVEPDVVKNIVTEIITKTTHDVEPITTNSSKSSIVDGKYIFIPILIISILLYVFTYILSKANVFSTVTHRKIWNILLSISFLFSVILGLFLVIRINYGILFYLPFNILYWHVEFGIVMAIISTFHVLWHLQYYKSLFKKRN